MMSRGKLLADLGAHLYVSTSPEDEESEQNCIDTRQKDQSRPNVVEADLNLSWNTEAIGQFPNYSFDITPESIITNGEGDTHKTQETSLQIRSDSSITISLPVTVLSDSEQGEFDFRTSTEDMYEILYEEPLCMEPSSSSDKEVENYSVEDMVIEPSDESAPDDPDDPDFILPTDEDEENQNPNKCSRKENIVLEARQNIVLALNETPTGRKKRGRKRKFENQTKQIRKVLKNSNENHYNCKDKLVLAKQFKDFKCTCIRNCSNLIPKESRNQEFDKFWKLKDYSAQNMFICACIQECEKKRCYTGKDSRRNFSRVYKLKSTPVCQTMFTKTLGISTKRVNTALCKLRSNDLTDKRGKAQGGVNKVSDEMLEEVKNQINKLPRYKSHYRRETTDSEYFPPEMTLKKMYGLYTEEANNPVSFATYRRIFLNNFNLKFKSLKKDTCNKCKAYAAISASANGEKRKEAEDLHKQHIELAERARSEMKACMEKAAQDDSFECLSFDLEKTLPLPRIPTNIIFYKRQLWLYNAGIHSGKKGQGYFYVWVENQAGRGAQEIGSCLFKHILTHINENVKNLVLFCDSCGGQNHNIKILLILKACLESHMSLESITIKYLVPGHTFLPNDTDFSDVECALKHTQRLYLPSDYISLMKTCRKKRPFIVTPMTTHDFLGTEKVEKMIVNRKKGVDDTKINWLTFREIKIEKNEPLKFQVKTNFDGTFVTVDLERKPAKGRPKNEINFRDSLIKIWMGGKDIAAPKLKDLKSVLHLIPSDAKRFYTSLTGSTEVEDDLEGYCVPLDFEVEEDV